MEFAHILTAIAAFAGMAAWDLMRTWLFSKWMVSKISKNSAGHRTECPKCGATVDVSVSVSNPN